MIQGIRICHLRLHRGTVSGFVLFYIKFFLRCRTETGVGGMIPLHGRAGTGASVTALYGVQIFHIAHTNLITVIQERCTGHGQKECKCHL